MDLLLSFLLLVSSYIFYHVITTRRKNLPPGPFPLPIVGNIFQLRNASHITFTNLARKYGPLMRLKLGSKETIIVSSIELAREILTKHDLAISGKITPQQNEAFDHHKYSVISIDVGAQWNTLRRIFKEQLLSSQKLEESEPLRQTKLRQLRDYLAECSRSGTTVDIGEAVMVTNLCLMFKTLFSMDYAAYGEADTHGIREAIFTVTRNAATPNPADYFPILRHLDLKGLQRKTRVAFQNLLRVIDELVSKRLEERKMPSYSRKPDILEELLDVNQTGELSLTFINHLLMDIILGGGESTSTFVQWVMGELLRDPKKMQKAKAELRSVLGNRQAVESDIPNLHYMSALIKETFRFQLGAPLLGPHRAIKDVKINGYTIPKDSTIHINVYAITRDPKVWSDPESFVPERFLGNNIDYKGKHFELLPFGSGRRICPGIQLVHLTAHTLVAHFIHSFDWKVEEEVSVDTKPGFYLFLNKPIRAIPVAIDPNKNN